MEKFDTNMFLKFLSKATCSYTCTNIMEALLKSYGFEEMSIDDNSYSFITKESSLYKSARLNKNLKENGKYYTKRGSSIIAFKTGINNKQGFNIVLAHSDSPALRVKKNPNMKRDSYNKLAIAPYGGLINYTWFDRPLSVSGRIVFKKDSALENKVIDIEKSILTIPSQAIHNNRTVNQEFKANYSNDMLPIMYLGNYTLDDYLIKNYFPKSNDVSIKDSDLFVYNNTEGQYLGLNKELIQAPRLDNISSVYPALEALTDSKDGSFNLLCVFGSEEIGSMKRGGADSPFLTDTLATIMHTFNMKANEVIPNSFIISADAAHATHPNHYEKHDSINKVFLNEGVTIKNHENYSTDAMSSAIYKEISEQAKVPYQQYEANSDLRAGATVGGIVTKYSSIRSVDIGIPMLAMHSAIETIGTKDLKDMYKVLNQFYNTEIINNKGKIKIRTR